MSETLQEKQTVIVTEAERHNHVNEFTEEERVRIHNEVSKVVESESEPYCPSPTEIKKSFASLLSVVRALAGCTHPGPEVAWIGAISWCRLCGAVRRPKPTPTTGVPCSDGEWEVPGLVGRL
jgi:hypothetical protein